MERRVTFARSELGSRTSRALFIFVVFVFIPLGRTFYLSFFNTRSTGVISTFNGIDHYIDLVTSATFRSSLLATGTLCALHRALGIALGLVLAVLLNQRLRGISVFRTMMASTIAISARSARSSGCSSSIRASAC